MESIVYAVDWNQVRENVFSGAAWLGGSSSGGTEVIEQLRKPTVLVCSSKGAQRNHLAGGRKKRDELLLDMIRACVTRGGTVLIPTDTSARVLELAYILEHAWRREASQNKTGSFLLSTGVFLASRSAIATIKSTKSMLEWMDESVAQEFQTIDEPSKRIQRPHKRSDNLKALRDEDRQDDRDEQASGKSGGPFDFKYIKIVERRSRLNKILSADSPKVIIASDTSLEWGFSREVLRNIASNPANLVILTEDYGDAQGSETKDAQSVGRTLWQWYQERRDGVAMETDSEGQGLEQVYIDGRDLQFAQIQRHLLAGNELLIYQQYLATQRQLQTTHSSNNGANLETSADAIDDASSTSSTSSDESDPERQGKSLNISATLSQANRNKLGSSKENTGVNSLLSQPGVYDYDVRGKKGRETIFPFANKKRRGDDFGDLIRPEEYLRAEERDEIDGQDMRNGTSKQIALGQKRKWEESGLQSGNDPHDSSRAPRRQKFGDKSRGDLTANRKYTDQNGFEVGIDDISDDSDTEAEEPQAGPSKILSEEVTIQANMRIAHVDFAGLHDQRTLSMLIPLIQPRKLILVGGSREETSWLTDECKQKLNPHTSSGEEGGVTDVFSPAIQQTVNASVDTNAWTVKLSEALVKRFRWQNVRGLGVVTLMGRLAATLIDEQPGADLQNKKRRKVLKGETESPNLYDIPTLADKISEVAPTLDVLPPNIVAATRSIAQPLHVGDLRLADLRKVLQSHGHTAEFRGEGILLIDGLVAVRKSGTGHIEVEGGGLQMPDPRTRTIDGSFYAVKRRIYEGLAIIAGG